MIYKTCFENKYNAHFFLLNFHYTELQNILNEPLVTAQNNTDQIGPSFEGMHIILLLPSYLANTGSVSGIHGPNAFLCYYGPYGEQGTISSNGLCGLWVGSVCLF